MSANDVSYRADIDGLRALAVGVVVLFHAGARGFSGGFVGVDVFFVISGFLITKIIHSQITRGTFTLTDFYARRSKRILPALFVVLAACLVAGWFFYSPREFVALLKQTTATVMSSSNIYYARAGGYFAGPTDFNSLLMTWSLGVEEQFYLVFPWLLMACARWPRLGARRTVVAVSVLSFAAACFVLARTPDSPKVFYFLPFRAWELGVGAVLALAPLPQFRDRRVADVLSVGGLVAIAWSVFSFDANTVFPGANALFPCLGAAALVVTGDSFVARKVLSARPLVALGSVSYSLYLWHWPILAFARTMANGPLSPQLIALCLVLALVLSVASCAWIEQPFRRSKTPPKQALIRYGAALAGAFALCLAIWQGYGFPGRFSAVANHADRAVTRVPGNRGACHVHVTDAMPTASSLPDRCFVRRPGGTIILLGDSHADSLSDVIGEFAERQNLGLVQLTLSGTPPLLGTRVVKSVRGAYQERATDVMPKLALSLIPSVRAPVYVFISSRWQYYTDGGFGFSEHDLPPIGLVADSESRATFSRATSNAALERGLRLTTESLGRLGARVVLFGDIPDLGFDPGACSFGREVPLRRELSRDVCAGPTREVVAGRLGPATSTLRRLAGESANVCAFELAPQLFDGRAYFYERDEVVLYRDDDHVNNDGAALVLRDFDLDRCFARD
jgi:peptidoglycan/LPS O-acetylase OafA/YrhL